MREAIRASDVDLVFLQEVHGRHDGHAKKFGVHWPESAQFEYLADKIWSHYAYGRNAVYDGGDHGNAILSKYPIVRWENFDVSTNRFEQRGILHAEIQAPEWQFPLHCVCLHFNLLRRSRSRQLAELCAIVNDRIPHDAPLIIGGDFNDWSRRATGAIGHALGVHEAFQVVHGRYARSYPSRLPFVPLDRVYFRGFEVRAAEVLREEPWGDLSDHVALRVVLGWSG